MGIVGRVRMVMAGLLVSCVVLTGVHAAVRTALPAPMTLAGVGGVAPGMTVAEVQRAWSLPIVATGTGPCRTARIATGPVRGYALFLEGRLGAVFFTAGIRTDRGVSIGSTLADIDAAYGKSVFGWPGSESRTALHVYTRPRYRGDGRALRFDIDTGKRGRVSRIGVGGRALTFSSGRC